MSLLPSHLFSLPRPKPSSDRDSVDDSTSPTTTRAVPATSTSHHASACLDTALPGSPYSNQHDLLPSRPSSAIPFDNASTSWKPPVNVNPLNSMTRTWPAHIAGIHQHFRTPSHPSLPATVNLSKYQSNQFSPDRSAGRLLISVGPSTSPVLAPCRATSIISQAYWLSESVRTGEYNFCADGRHVHTLY